MTTELKNKSKTSIFIGIDVATRTWAICIVSSEGELLERMNIEAEFEILRKILRKYEDSESPRSPERIILPDA